MNQTIIKFGYPATLVADLKHWVILLRPAQPTLGSMVLAAKSDATALSDLPEAAHQELKAASAVLEGTLRKFVSYDKINYLMLMMVDPHVHFHVIPRYEDAREWQGLSFPDSGWPGVPDLAAAKKLSDAQIQDLSADLRNLLR